MISGYYCYAKESSWIKKKAFGILKMLLLSELFYGVWKCLRTFLTGEAIADYLKGLPVLAHPARTLLCGTVFNGVLWYLYAAFWSYCILYVFSRINGLKTLRYLLIPVLLCLHIFGRFYWQNHYDIESDNYLFENVFLLGLPFTLYGSLFAELEKKIKAKFNWRKSIMLGVFGGLLMIAEYFISGQYMDIHLSTVFTSAGLFLLAMTYPFAPIRPLKFVSYIGHRLSMPIYLSHTFFNSVTNLIAVKYGLESHPLFLWGDPILVCVCSGLFAFLFNSLRKGGRDQAF